MRARWSGCETQPGATRSSLARDPCDPSGWRERSGARAEASARKLLPRLAARLSIILPAPGAAIAREIRCTLEEPGTVRLVPVEDQASRRRREAMIAAWNSLGWARSPGRQACYWIESSCHGLLGGIGFAPASWHQKARDRWIGWCDDARVAHLDEIVCNQRYLLCPWVHVPNLASHVLAMATALLADDWEAAGGCRPLLVYTYVAPEHAGSCHAAAGWERCDELTSGVPPGQTQPGRRLAVWMKPLAADWKPRLCAVPARSIEAPPTVYLADSADGGIPIGCLLTSASLHDSQAAIPLATQTGQRVTYLYELMDAAYDAKQVHEFSKSMGHVAIIDPNPRRDAALKEALRQDAKAQRALNYRDATGGPLRRTHQQREGECPSEG